MSTSFSKSWRYLSKIQNRRNRRCLKREHSRKERRAGKEMIRTGKEIAVRPLSERDVI